MRTLTPIEQRKADHLTINLEEDVQARNVTAGFDRYRFMHQALPELDLDEVDVRTTFLGYELGAPLLISSMTGGIEDGWAINQRLARAAEAHGCAIGVGSQRAALDDPTRARYFQMRDAAPTVPIFANIGAVQLNYGYGVEECRRAVEMVDANALILHLNPLQEALQAEGNRNFSGLLAKIEAVCRALEVPVIVKEIGAGISPDVARKLADAGVAAIDVAGTGGTSWSKVEGLRATVALHQRLGSTFAEWGIPTATSLAMARAAAPDTPLIASGGLLTGLDATKAIALGADLAGFAGPLLRAASISEEAVFDLLEALIVELRLAMFCAGAANVAVLKQAWLISGDDAGGDMFLRIPPAERPVRDRYPSSGWKG